MLTENGLNIDMDAVNNALTGADVLTIGFATFPQRLIIDFRQNATTGTMAAIVPPVATVQERYLWLGRHRGEFGAPQGFVFFVWPHTVRTLLERDVMAPAARRLDPEGARQLGVALEELQKIEREAFRSAVRGDAPAWQTLWQRAA